MRWTKPDFLQYHLPRWRLAPCTTITTVGMRLSDEAIMAVEAWSRVYTRQHVARQQVAFSMLLVAGNMLLEVTCCQQNCCQFVARLLLYTKIYMLPRYRQHVAWCKRGLTLGCRACKSHTCTWKGSGCMWLALPHNNVNVMSYESSSSSVIYSVFLFASIILWWIKCLKNRTSMHYKC